MDTQEQTNQEDEMKRATKTAKQLKQAIKKHNQACIETLKQQNAELLEALKLAYENLSDSVSAPAMYEIEDVIAKAEGRPV